MALATVTMLLAQLGGRAKAASSWLHHSSRLSPGLNWVPVGPSAHGWVKGSFTLPHVQLQQQQR